MKGILFAYVLIATSFISVYSDVQVVQEGLNYTFEYINSTNIICETFLWSQNNRTLNKCFNEKSDFTLPVRYKCAKEPFNRPVESQIKMDEKKELSANLTIVNVYRNKTGSDEGLWKLNCTAINTPDVTTFQLKIYSEPKYVECTHNETASNLTLTCRTEGSFPPVNFIVNTSLNQNFIQGACQNTLDSTSLYYNSACTYGIPVTDIQIGTLVLNMTVYPDVTSSVRDRDLGASKLLTLNIEKPSINLTNCIKTEIGEKMPLNCMCQRSDNSELSTTIIWIINGTKNTSSTNKNIVLTSLATRYNTNYTCVAINSINYSSSSLMYSPNVLHPADATKVYINEILQNQSILENGFAMKIRCESIGNPLPSLTLRRNLTQLSSTTANNTLMWGKAVDCNDSGDYLCSANNRLGNSQQGFKLFIKCPQQLQDPFYNDLIFKSRYGEKISIKVNIFGYPKPETYVLMRRESIVLTKNYSILQMFESYKYEIGYNEDFLTYGNVKITIFNISSKDFDNYTLVIFNGEKGNLTFSFSIEQAVRINDDKDSNTAAIAGGCIGAFAAVIVVIVIIFVSRRKSDCQCIKSNETNIIELSESVRPKVETAELPHVAPGKKKKNGKRKNQDKDITEKIDSMMNILQKIETRQQVLEEKLKSQSPIDQNDADYAQRAHYDVINQPGKRNESKDENYVNVANDNANYGYQKITPKKVNYENII